MKLWLCLLLVGLSVSLAEEDHVIVLDAKNFDNIVRQGDIVVEFYAPWCGHCKKLAPEYSKAAKILKESNSKIRLGKCDVDNADNKPLATRFGVKGFPTIRLFRNGTLENPEEYSGPRTAEGIVKEVESVFGPPSKFIASKEDAEKLTRGETVVVGVFGKEGPESAIFLEAAEKLRSQKFIIAHTFNPKLLEPCKSDPDLCTGSMVFMLLALDKNITKFGGDFEVQALYDWAIKISTPRLTELIQTSPRHMQKVQSVFQKPEPRLIAFGIPDSAEIDDLKNLLIEVDEANSDFNVIYIDGSINSKAARFFGLEDGDYPSLVMHDHSGGTKFVHKKATITDVKPFIENWRSGKLEPTIKSEDPPKDESGPVKVLVGKTFKDVLASGKSILMEFYAPWCGHCKKLAPTYDKLGEHFKDNQDVIIAKIDVTANDIPDSRFQIKGFPTLKFLKREGDIVDYAGDRSLEDLVKFVNGALGIPNTAKKDESSKMEEPAADVKEEL